MKHTHEVLSEDHTHDGAAAPAFESEDFEEKVNKINSDENRSYLRAIYKKMAQMTEEADFYGYLGNENESYKLSTSDSLLERVTTPKHFWYEMYSVAEKLTESDHESFKVFQLLNNRQVCNVDEFIGTKHNPNDNKIFGKYASQPELFAYMSMLLAPNLETDGELEDIEAIASEIKRGAEVMCRLGEPKTTNKLLDVINRSLSAEGHGVQVIGVIKTESGEQVTLTMLEQRGYDDSLERITLCLSRRGNIIEQFMRARDAIINVEKGRRQKTLRDRDQELVGA